MPASRARRSRCTRIAAPALLPALLALLALAPIAHAAPPPAGGGTAAPGSAQTGKGSEADERAKASPPAAEPSASATGAKELGAAGQVDPITGLGIRNPVCDRPGEIREEATRRSCRLNGTPESAYPVTNYGFDVFIDSGVDAPAGSFAKALVMLLNGIWLGLLFVLKLVIALLGLAFGLNPFTDGEAMGRIAAAIARVYERITDPWLSALVVCAGIWFAYKGLVRREVAAGVSGTLAAVALLILGLWVVHAPRQSVGRAAAISDQLALGVIAAPQSGSLSRSTGGFAEAVSRTWAQLVEVPFAGLNFSDVQWALGPPPPEAVARADAKFCEDIGVKLSLLQSFGDDLALQACARAARRRYGSPRRVIDLYLRSSPGSPARRALWQYFDKDEADAYKAKVAAQGGDGVLTRLSMLALFAVGLGGAIALLAWLAIRLFTQAAIGFVLILAAPFALFFPLLGDSGRRAFKRWGLALLGAILAKVIYAAFLSVTLLGLRVLGGVGGAEGFLLSSAFAWSVFLRRAELIGWLSIGGIEPAGPRDLLGRLLALGAARQVWRGGARLARGGAQGAAAAARSRIALGGAATRETARDSLASRARDLAEQRRREPAPADARSATTGDRPDPEARRSERGSAATASRRPEGEDATGGREARATKTAGSRPGANAPGPPREAEPAPLAREPRFGEREVERFAERDRALLRGSREPVDHAHRIGMQRAEFEALRGPERERAERAIEVARRRDVRRMEVAEETPGRVVGRGRQLVEGLRQRAEGDGATRREHLRRLRREVRERRSAARHNLSRGI